MINKKLAYFIIVLIFFFSSYISYSYFSNHAAVFTSPFSSAKSGSKIIPTEIPQEPKTEECPLNGEMLGKSLKEKWEKRRPLGIMIENHKESRPQSGLSSADIVYEAVAEGGITRFLAVYYCKDASIVGPVRSARVHFMNMLSEYGDYPLYAHVGGANCDAETGSGCANGAPADALGLIRKWGWDLYNDMNQFGVPFPYFWRDYERLPNRATEHTVYSSTSKLWQYAKDKRDLTDIDEDGNKWNKNFTSWKFKDDAKSQDRGNVSTITFGFWNSFASDFQVIWKYNLTSNSYKRTNGGQAHIDKNTDQSIEAKNIVIIFSKESPANDGYDGGHILYKLMGSGDGYIFQNGKKEEITWEKEDRESRMKFYNSSGDEVSIVRGQVFVEILPIGNKVETN